MKNALIIVLLILATISYGQVAVNEDGSNANSSAMFDVKSSDKGVLIPRLSNAQRDAISNPATGLLVFVTTDSSFYFFSGSDWVRLNSLRADNPDEPIPIKFQGSILYVHPTDNSPGEDWGALGTSTGANSYTDGEANTAILAAIGGSTAAVLCNGLNAFGFNDWYLPSKYELDAIYKQSYMLQDLEQVSDQEYWSSTERDNNHAWTQRLDYGAPDPVIKDNPFIRVRCVRKD